MEARCAYKIPFSYEAQAGAAFGPFDMRELTHGNRELTEACSVLVRYLDETRLVTRRTWRHGQQRQIRFERGHRGISTGWISRHRDDRSMLGTKNQKTNHERSGDDPRNGALQ